MAAHRYWRVRWVRTTSASGVLSATKIEMRGTPGGADQCTGGTAYSNVATNNAGTGGGSPAAAFDASTATWWSTGTNNTPNGYIAYDFGLGVAVEVQQIAFTARNDANRYDPVELAIEWSDDNAAWTLAWKTTTTTAWTAGETRTLTNPNPTLAASSGARKYWRLWFETNVGLNGSNTSIYEVQFVDRPGGTVRTTTGGTAISDRSTPANAFDGSISTFWAAGTNSLPNWLGYNHAAPVHVGEVRILNQNTNWELYSPRRFSVEYSDDGIGWYVALDVSNADYTGPFQMKSWLVPGWDNAGASLLAGAAGAYALPGTGTGQAVSTAGAYALTGTAIGPAVSTAGVYVADFRLEMRKAAGGAVVSQSIVDRVNLRKASGYVLISSAAELTLRKALGYAVLDDGSVSASARRRPLVMVLG